MENKIDILREFLKLYVVTNNATEKEKIAVRILKIRALAKTKGDKNEILEIEEMLKSINQKELKKSAQGEKIGLITKFHNLKVSRKMAILVAAGAIAMSVTSCQNTQTITNVSPKTVDKDKNSNNAYDSDRFNRHPLASQSIVDMSVNWAQLMADNGILNEVEAGNDKYSLAAISTTFNSGHGDTSKFIDALALGQNFASGFEEIKSNIDAIRADHEQIIRGYGKIDYSKLTAKKQSSKLLDKFNNMWVNYETNQSQTQIDEFNKELQTVREKMENYDPFTVFLITDYVTLGYEAGIYSKDKYETFYKAFEGVCLENLSNSKSVTIDDIKLIKNDLEIANTIESKKSVLLYSNFISMLKDVKHKHSKNEKYNSYTEIGKKISAKIKHITNNPNVNIIEKGDKIAVGFMDKKITEKFGPVKKADPKSILPDGTIDSGITKPQGPQIGDTVTGPTKDEAGNIVDENYETSWDKGYNDYFSSKGQKKDPAYANSPGYQAGWNVAHELTPEFKEEEEIIQKNPSTNDGNQNTTPEVAPPANDNNQNTPPEVAPPANDVDQDIPTMSEDEFLNSYEMGPDGNWYPKGTFETSKTR